MARKKRQRSERGSGSMSVKDNGKYEYRISYKDEFGKTRRKSFSEYTMEECYRRAEEFFEELDKRRRGIDVDATIPSLVEGNYRRKMSMNYIGEQSYYRGMETLGIIMRSPIGSIPIVSVTKDHIFFFLGTITTYSNSVIEKVYNQLKIAYAEAMLHEIVPRNLMLDPDMKRPKSVKEDKEVQAFTEEQQAIFLDALKKHVVPENRSNYKNQLLVSLYTGLRMGEVNALRADDIDFDKGVIRVRRTVSQGKSSRPFLNKTTKTYAGRREVPLSKDAVVVLKAALKAAKSNPEKLIFYDYNNMHIVSTNQVNCFFQRIIKKAGIEIDGGQHALRHTFATRCIEAGIQAVVLKKWMGHTDIHVTLDTYASVFDRMNNNS
ncbi:MAG: site-specific integrase, partial [Mogibacterium sp.]|nr:site-specific integrase [Mogibacterium sp.]